MSIKTFVEKLDDAPEGLREFYTEVDGRFVLDVEGIDEHPAVSNLRNAYQKVKESDKQARSDLKTFKEKAGSLPDDFDADLWKKVKSGELQDGSKVKVAEQTIAERDEAIKRAEQAESRLNSLTIDRAIGDALDAANITNPAFRKGATALLRDSVKLDGEKVFVDSDMGPLDPKEYVKKWAATDEGKPFVSQPKGGGSRSGDPNVTSSVKSWGDAKTTKERVEFLKSKQ